MAANESENNEVQNLDDNNICPPADNQPENENEEQNNNYQNQRLEGKCGCELCRSGVATTHNDDSHDQSLNSNFQLDGDISVNITFVGGTTKCGRVMSNYFSSLADRPFEGKKAIELGAGTGIVGCTLAHVGCQVVMTDMGVALDIPQYNVNNAPQNIREKITCKPLLWGEEEASQYIDEGHDFVIGSDLIYAHENIPPLVKTYEVLTDPLLPNGKHPVAYLAVIRRFNWEEKFFELMKNKFSCEAVLTFGDITINRYTRLEDLETETTTIEEN